MEFTGSTGASADRNVGIPQGCDQLRALTTEAMGELRSGTNVIPLTGQVDTAAEFTYEEPGKDPPDGIIARDHGTNPFVRTENDALSTFALDVDTGSYTVARRCFEAGELPDPSLVRVEEFVNFFDQD